jgi:hypothetical protein
MADPSLTCWVGVGLGLLTHVVATLRFLRRFKVGTNYDRRYLRSQEATRTHRMPISGQGDDH